MSARRFIFLLAVAAVILVAASARADDFMPPNWRGQPGSTFQVWTFDTPEPVPTRWDNPYGQPIIESPFVWEPGVAVAPELTFRVPNRPLQDPFKLIRLQVTLRTPGLIPDQGVLDIWSDPKAQWRVTDYGIEPTPIPELWRGWADITLWPNPYVEWIRLGSTQTAPFWWDQVVIDTWCPPVPEPMSMTLAGMGLLGIIGASRRKR